VSAIGKRAAGALIALCLGTAQAPAVSPARPWMNTALLPEARAQLVLADMRQDEKLTLVFGYFASDFDDKNYHPPAEARPGSAGYVPGIPRLGIPPQWQTDAGLGVATQREGIQKRGRTALPSGLGTAATWNPWLAHAGGAMIGAEAAASGFNVMLAGGVNLMREPRNGRNFEYGGEDPLLAGTMVGAQIAGVQSNHIIATVKHFALNDQETDRFHNNSIIDPAAARMSDLLAFQIAIERGRPGAVMCSYNLVNGVHACENPWLLSDVLRRDWGYRGYVMSDWGGAHSTVAAVRAGLDQQSGHPFDDQPYFAAPLKAAIEDGSVSEAQLDRMASHILTSMFANGLFDHPIREAAFDLPEEMLARHAAVTRADAEEAAVLLKNAGDLLPLSPSVKRIAVIGGHADKGVLAGNGSSLVQPVGGNAVPAPKPDGWTDPVMYYPNAPLDAIRRLAPQAEVVFADGSDIDAAAALARSADVAIVFGTQWAGEGIDVPLSLRGTQDQLIDAVAAANRKTVVVLETGGPVLTPWRDKAAAILEAWFPGTAGGDAIANLLFGKVVPSGRLPVTFPASLDQLPRPAFPHPGDTHYDEGATVGYKWYDANGLEPAFPFGHGLSYTRFTLSGLTAHATAEGVRVGFTVRNIGARAGRDVAQIYVAGSGWEAPKRLGGFRKVALAPGEANSFEVTIDSRLFATADATTGGWRIAGGPYRVMLGASSRDIAQTVTVNIPARTLAAGWHPDLTSSPTDGQRR
jgi:beta-glucosidase